ncbi:MAG: FHA domain-containing protein, partial [Selenomonadaceae bacterium]|nr:FHA domain-containing protein [Selenomonadaceae bacterium]
MNGLIRCQNGHLFSSRRYGTVCPYCNVETATQEKKETHQQTEVDVDEMLFMNKIQPVCGWIVCIEGPRQGKDYKIH